MAKKQKIPQPKMHKPYYLLHRYWGRKPHNIFSYLIQQNTKENEMVLDPFMGSGVTVIESNLLNRRTIGIDINPFSKFLTKVTLSKVDKEELKKDLNFIIDNIPEDVNKLFLLEYKNNKYDLMNCIWENNVLTKIKGQAPDGKKIIKKPDSLDKKKLLTSKVLLNKYKDKYSIKYPQTEIFKFVMRSGIKTLDKLFTDRNLLVLALIKRNIMKLKKQKNKEFFLLVLSSILSSVSSMIPGDQNKVTGKSGWVISKFWKPNIHTEKNPIKSFTSKSIKSIEAKGIINDLISPTPFKIYTRSSEKMEYIKDKSIDLILTDPPYGDSIAYLGLSMIWNEWLDLKPNYKNEIIIDNYRDKRVEDYSTRLFKVFSECYRVLKNEKKLIFTFHNRHLKYWKVVMDSCLSAGFILNSVLWIDQANISGTQGINKKNTLKGDFIYTFKKSNKTIKKTKIKNSILKIKERVQSLIKINNNLTTAKLYQKLIPFIVNNNYYYDNDLKIIDLDKFLFNNFDYKQKLVNSKIIYIWKNKKK